MDFRVLTAACFLLTFMQLELTMTLSSHSWHTFCRMRQVSISKKTRERDKMVHTHLPFVEESVEVGVPDLDWRVREGTATLSPYSPLAEGASRSAGQNENHEQLGRHVRWCLRTKTPLVSPPSHQSPHHLLIPIIRHSSLPALSERRMQTRWPAHPSVPRLEQECCR
jgi:hypothetical protein